MGKDELIIINDNFDLQYLLTRFTDGPKFASQFSFGNEELYWDFLKTSGIDVAYYQKNHYFFDSSREIHIAEDQNGFVWISTIGLIAKSRITENQFINACSYQKTVLMLLIDYVSELCNVENCYDITSPTYGKIEEIAPTLYHNIIFYYEVLLKSYLSINGKTIQHTHSIKTLRNLAKKTMNEKQQNNTMLHAYIIPMIDEIISHFNSIPGSFKEEYIKYDDNPTDTTSIVFDRNLFCNMRDLVEISYDIVTEMFYSSSDCFYLKPGLYERLMERCKTEEDKNRIYKTWHFLVEETSLQ